ncbi:MAG: hypothetical protein WKF66_12755 [Pedobacter sp.]
MLKQGRILLPPRSFTRSQRIDTIVNIESFSYDLRDIKMPLFMVQHVIIFVGNAKPAITFCQRGF